MKYQPYPKVNLKDRTWPDNEITKPPIWCSVDLRDGNQALVKPMDIDEKLKLFKLLVDIGFKEIEIGFPSASETEFEFTRKIIEDGLIPDDVSIQVLTQAREHLIAKTALAVKGAKNVILHLYNSTSVAQRKIVFKKTKEEIIELALNGVRIVKEEFKNYEGNLRLEYSPESFTGTELEFSCDICDAVVGAWNPKKDEKVIINLPATVELSTPNIYADQVEWMIRNLKHINNIYISVHNHNDRGTAVASSELALMAGAHRIEGTLFGNGERTGNVDIVTLALNMFTQGIDPKLKFNNLDEIRKVVEDVTDIKTHLRHPYVGDMVYTAFSGSHQDAIKKGMDLQGVDTIWEVPYLPIDPSDVGRDYEAIIMINSQSGKGGVSYILKSKYGYKIPKGMQAYVGIEVQKISDKSNRVLQNSEILKSFESHFVNRNEIVNIKNITLKSEKGKVSVKADFIIDGKTYHKELDSSGAIEAISEIFKELGIDFKVLEYSEHSLGSGAEAKAAAYFGIKKDNKIYYGVGIDDNITHSSIKGLISAINLSYKK
ncbi:MAG: 2-isopropylmalate synthase (EC [uncultured Campylobacterales bacterium]|uniref:2-isopropylmalate synthase n=1 Tax=uncultured Campylobacterales bacterium TaxID=352960 RepID=A0A6S6T509_9BACT|nr:MAG: 2-isopropylmalate synthase (EC [uncultured Campylobacterales bacterium]